MKSFKSKMLLLAAAVCLAASFSLTRTISSTHADELDEITAAATSISISPVSKILQLSANSVYDDSFKVTNNGSGTMEFEVYAAPYSYTYSEDEKAYKLGFSSENAYTQMTRWITFQDIYGNYVETTTFSAEPGEAVEVSYRISTPMSIPAGGQYAVLFAHTLSNNITSSGIKTEASPGLVIYGRGDGETVISGEISDLAIHQTMEVDGDNKNLINASAKIKNTGNVDFMAAGTLRVEGIFGRAAYETPSASSRARTSIIPETELEISDSWDETPYFGLFHVSWTVAAAGETETIESVVLILPPPVLITIILLLTTIIVWIIIVIRKRKERRSKFKL